MKLSTPHSVRLNLRLAPADAGFYRVELRAGDQVREATVAADTLPVAGVLDTQAYGRQLFTWLLGDTELKSMWQKLAIQFPARRSIFLQIDDRAPELNMVPWELLRDDDLVLAADEHTPFIRYVPVAVTAPRPAVDPLRVLVAIAAPQIELDDGVEPINLDVERYLLGILQTHKRVQADLLGVDTPCTLANLDQALARGYHVLHLVSHGASDPARGTLLLLADADNRPRWVDEDTVAQMLRRHVGMGVDDPRPTMCVRYG
ncbi:MAG: CHAT domain-containing protein [Caldilineaceae bacterium]